MVRKHETLFLSMTWLCCKAGSFYQRIGGEVFQLQLAETTVSEITGSFAEIMKKHGYPDVEVVNAEVRVGDVKRNFSDTSKVRTRLGWVPKTISVLA